MRCEFCNLDYTHLSGCPNEIDKRIYSCDICDGGIYEGEYFYSLDNIVYCVDCMNDYKHTAEVDYGEKENL